MKLRLGRSYDRKPQAGWNDIPLYGFEKGVRAQKGKLFKMKDLTIPKIIEMHNFLNNDNPGLSLFCDRFKLSYQLGSRLNKLLTQNLEALAELISKMQSKMKRDKMIRSAVDSILESRKSIWTSN